MIGLMAMAVAVSSQQRDLVQIYGMGSISCATAWQPENARASSDWVLGLWSGRNFEGSSSMVGASTDQAGIVGEVKLACEKAPSDSLVHATIEVYNAMRATHR